MTLLAEKPSDGVARSCVQVAEQLVQRTKVLRWVLARLKPREWDTNKGLVGEALAALLQASPAAAQALAALNGIDALLQVRISACMHACLLMFWHACFCA